MKRNIKQPKKQRKNLFLPLFIIIILVSSFLGLIWKDKDSETYREYKGYKFTKVDNQWATLINGKQIFFDYSPEELEAIAFPLLSKDINKIYLAFDPEQRDTNINYILQKTTESLSEVGIRSVLACIKDSPSCPDIPIVNCKNDNTVIQILKTDEVDIFEQDNCIILKGDIYYLNKGMDKFRLNLLVS